MRYKESHLCAAHGDWAEGGKTAVLIRKISKLHQEKGKFFKFESGTGLAEYSQHLADVLEVMALISSEDENCGTGAYQYLRYGYTELNYSS